MRYYIISGEASGDLHAANLVKQLASKDQQADFRGWGGDHMAAAGVTLVKHIRELAFMGFTEVLLNLRTILKNIKFCKSDIESYNPDVIILIDYPGFNMRIGAWAKSRNIKVVYYIAPQIWAWKKSRVHKIAQFSSQICVVLPFEKEFFRENGYDVDYVGHPILDAIKQRDKPSFQGYCEENDLPQKPIIALLPGSRKQEIKRMLPIMLKSASKYLDSHQIVLAGAPAIDETFYSPFLRNSDVNVQFNKTYDLLEQSHIALVSSGTATLETALFRVPQVVCYKGGLLSYLIARALVNIKYISLVNLIMDREVVVELIQSDLSVKKTRKIIEGLLPAKSEMRLNQLKDYEELHKVLGKGGASEKAANLVLKTLRSDKVS